MIVLLHPKFNSVWLVEILFYLYQECVTLLLVRIRPFSFRLLRWWAATGYGSCAFVPWVAFTQQVISSNSGRFDVKASLYNILAFFADSAVILVLDMHSKPCHSYKFPCSYMYVRSQAEEVGQGYRARVLIAFFAHDQCLHAQPCDCMLEVNIRIRSEQSSTELARD